MLKKQISILEKRCKKDWVSLCWTGCKPPPIHRRYPTTAPHGDFCLLRFRPGPVRPSLDDLVGQSSDQSTISMPSLAWTPDRHRATTYRTPRSQTIHQPRLPSNWITGARHNAQSKVQCEHKTISISFLFAFAFPVEGALCLHSAPFRYVYVEIMFIISPSEYAFFPSFFSFLPVDIILIETEIV